MESAVAALQKEPTAPKAKGRGARKSPAARQRAK
jgi:hypothetical protein